MNVDWLARLPAPVRRALYFGLQSAIGAQTRSAWADFLRWERLPAPALELAVDQRLTTLLAQALSQSQHYRSLKVDRLRPGETGRDWLQRFPILTRSTVREAFRSLVIDSLQEEIAGPESVCPHRYGWLVVKTGGSTGMPTTVVHDARARDSGRATRLYAQRLSGFPLGTPYFRLWGSEQDLLQQELALPQRLLRALHAEIPLNAFRAREADLRRHYAHLQARPSVRHLMAYVDAAAGLAQFIEDRKLPRPQFQSVMACAGTVTPEHRSVLERVFGAEVFDKYGSRECSDLACECPAHQGLHIFSPHAVLEIVDDRGQACPPGVPGRILVTLLNNLSFPMIRYEIGDLAAWATPGPCPCGSPFPRLQQLMGRQDDMLTTEDGTKVTSVFVRHFVGVSLNHQLIREWQLEQVGPRRFVFRHVPAAREGLEQNLAQLRNSFRTVFGPSAAFEFLEVQEIPPAPSGKVRWIINRCRP